MTDPRVIRLTSMHFARGYVAHIYYDISLPPDRCYTYEFLHGTEVVVRAPARSQAAIYELLDCAELVVNAACGLRAVLDRINGRPPEEPGIWFGSIGEFAARRFDVGTWEWVQTLVEYRKLMERCQQAPGDRCTSTNKDTSS